jgi:hypothetical protein
MPKEFPSQKLDKFVVRLPEGLRDKIGVASRAKHRSMNAEIVSSLDEKYSGQQVSGEPFDIVIPGNSAAADILFELKDMIVELRQSVKELSGRLSELEKTMAGLAQKA